MSLLYQLLEKQVAQSPEKLFVVEDETRWTYQEFQQKVNRLASALVKHGIQPGDRVALMYLNQKEFLVGFWAVLRAGGVVVPMNLQLPPQDMMFVLQDAGCRLVLATASLAKALEGKSIPVIADHQESPTFPAWEDAVVEGDPQFTPAHPDAAPNAMRILMYTSGTTGRPKGVMLSEENLMANLMGIDPVIQFAPEDRVLLALPLFHAFGLIIGIYVLSLGGTLALVPRFAPKKILHQLTTEKITILPLVPTMFGILLEGAEKVGVEAFQSLRLCVSGGASLPPDLLKRIESVLGMTVLEGYGMTETSPVLAVNSPEVGSIPRSVGKPLPNVEMKLVDDAGREVPQTAGEPSGEGEIWVRGPNVMLGYYNLPEATAEILSPDGWLKTGDLGHFDPQGNLFISGGRKKDLIIKAGENISPLRVEHVLHDHPAIMDASVIGVADPKLGEEVLACIQFRPGQSATEPELKKFCRQHLPPFMVPECFRVYEDLPKNPTGKVLKNVLREENPTIPRVST